MRRFLAAVAFASLSLLLLVPVSGRAQQDPASRALHFLAGAQAADGHVDGFDSNQGTEDFLLAAAAAGYDPNSLRNLGSGKSGYDYLAANIGPATSTAGRTGRLLQAVVAGGRPTTFAGTDLVARLESTLYNSTSGQYGDSDSFSQGLAILGLKAAGRPIPALAVAYLKGLQNADGSWYSGPAPALGAPPAQGDTNSTALALAALDAVPDHSRDSSALAYLHTQQMSDGGFPYQSPSPYPSFPASSDPDSTGLVIEALLGAGQAPTFSAWTKPGGATPRSWLLSNQDAASGGYIGYSGTPDAATTVQAVLGLALATVPVVSVHPAGFGLCAAATSAVSALRFLAGTQAADGHVDGFSPAQGTEDYILGAVAAGYDPGLLRSSSGTSAYDYLTANVSTATASAGSTGRLLEAVTAGGRGTVFGGVDLVARLEGTFYNPATGQYGSGSDAFSQSLAMLGLRSAGRTVPALAVTFLKSLQNPDGSWYFSLTPQAGDTNDTALALMALAAVGDHSADATSLAWLKGQQAATADGGFPYQAPYPSDVDSTALVLQALLADYQDPAAWIAAGSTPLAFLSTQQGAGGGYLGYSGTPDAITTVPVVVGLERLPYPIPKVFVAGRPLGDPGPTAGVCPAASPSPPASPTPTPSASSSPTPTLAPTATPRTTPSPSVSPTPAPAPVAALPSPTPSPGASPTPSSPPTPSSSPSPASTPRATPTATFSSQPGPTVAPGPPAGGGGPPTPLLYGLAALAGLVVVGGGGAAYLLLVRR